MRRSTNSVHSVLLTFTLLLSARAGAAQLAQSLDIGFPFFGPTGETHPALFQVGYRAASIKPLKPGVDVSIATVPVALMFGLIVISSDLDLTYPLPLGAGAILTPRVGGSVVVGGVVGSGPYAGGFGGTVGYNVGVGLVGRTGPTTAIRFDFTHRHFDVPLSSATIGFVWTP
jgi:hypothetical protein